MEKSQGQTMLEKLNDVFLGGSCLGSFGADFVPLNILVKLTTFVQQSRIGSKS
jgi:hypothetical protein